MKIKMPKLITTLITKKEVIKLIDESKNIIVVNAEGLMNEIIELPEVDAVPVVRCKDCRYRKTINETSYCQHPVMKDAYGGMLTVIPELCCIFGDEKEGDSDS